MLVTPQSRNQIANWDVTVSRLLDCDRQSQRGRLRSSGDTGDACVGHTKFAGESASGSLLFSYGGEVLGKFHGDKGHLTPGVMRSASLFYMRRYGMIGAANYTLDMKRKAKKPRLPGRSHSIRAYREASGLSVQEVSQKMAELGFDLAGASVSRIERGLQPYNQRQLEAFCFIFKCTVQDLVAYPPPSREEIEHTRKYRNLPPDVRTKLDAILDTLTPRSVA